MLFVGCSMKVLKDFIVGEEKEIVFWPQSIYSKEDPFIVMRLLGITRLLKY